MPEPMYTLREAAKVLNVSERTLSKLAQTYKGVKVGRQWRFPRGILDRIANRKKELREHDSVEIRPFLVEEE